METLYIVPARGGSKGIPGKNIKLLDGKPLIQHTIDEVRKIVKDEDICVSTDSSEIKSVVEEFGLHVPFLRPNELAQDDSSSESVLLHALNYYSSVGKTYEYIVLLQPTSPFRSHQHIRGACQLMKKDLDMVVSVKKTASNPYYVLFEESGEGYLKKSKEGAFTRRQDCPTVYELNGAIYVINVESLVTKGFKGFEKIVKYEMSEEDSLDIDVPLDWLIAEQVVKNRVI